MTAPGPLLDLATFQALVAGTGVEALRLSGIVRDIRDYCGWHIAPALDETLVVDGSGGPTQQLPTLLLNSVASVSENGVEVRADDYEWSRDGTLRRRRENVLLPLSGVEFGWGRAYPRSWGPPRWTHRYRGIAAVVNHGHPAVPENLVSVILDAASAAVAAPLGVAVGEPETMGPFTFGASTSGVEFSAAQYRVLDRFKVPGKP
ncbi:hypothetical protein [Nocardia brasiliensis]|uniref:hypothetical protein n=1 Tax=Nocardia brasiliensis TaxID=37326 RepID=UPI0024585043|nr:hypothetical protein [Nocardia brasiliensis]